MHVRNRGLVLASTALDNATHLFDYLIEGIIRHCDHNNVAQCNYDHNLIRICFNCGLAEQAANGAFVVLTNQYVHQVSKKQLIASYTRFITNIDKNNKDVR